MTEQPVWTYTHEPLETIRDLKGWSIAEAARRYGCSPSTWQRLAAGEEAPRIDDLLAFCTEAGASPDLFIRKRK